MISLNDYLYSGYTMPMILHSYQKDLAREAEETGSRVDRCHSLFLMQLIDILEHNEFLTSQSHRILEFYQYLTRQYPWLSLSFKGRIKSLIRAEEKFNGYIVEYVTDYYKKYRIFPADEQLLPKLDYFRDLIAYRIVISMPAARIPNAAERRAGELRCLYEIANTMPDFLKQRGLEAQLPVSLPGTSSNWLTEELQPYYRDYIVNPNERGYQSLHVSFYDKFNGNYTEIQLRTKEMDDFAEIGAANHMVYENDQTELRTDRTLIPVGRCRAYDEALERENLLKELELAKLDVNMFGAVNNSLINDSCGLFRGRMILPFEHLAE